MIHIFSLARKVCVVVLSCVGWDLVYKPTHGAEYHGSLARANLHAVAQLCWAATGAASPKTISDTRNREMRPTSYPVYRCAREREGPLEWVSLEKAQWLVASGGATWFRPRKLMLTNHNLYNIQIGDRHHRAGFTVGALRGRSAD